MKKVLILASVASMIDQFNMPNIQLLLELGFRVDVACNFVEGNTCSLERVEELKERLLGMSVRYYQIDFTRSVMNFHQDYIAYKQVLQLIKREKYQLVHCHSPIGGVIGRIAAHQTGTKVIYTAHGFHFYAGAPLLNWLIYYPVEKKLSRWTDVLIAINKEDFDYARVKFKMGRLFYVPGVGVNTQKYKFSQEIRERKRREMQCDSNTIILLSVGELSRRKNQEVTIKAVATVCEQVNINIKYFIVGQGSREEEYKTLIRKLNMEGHIRLLGFRTDIDEICCASDIFLFPSLQEGLPVALMEAMAVGRPIVCSDIRGNRDLVKDGVGGYLIKDNSPEEYAEKIYELIEDKNMRDGMSDINRRAIQEFCLEKIKKDMENIYQNIT